MKFELKNHPNFLKIETIEKLISPENLVNTIITVRSGHFNGEFAFKMVSVDFEWLKRGFKRLYNDLGGVFNFDCFDKGFLVLNIKGDGIGHFECDCIVNDNPGIYGTELTFRLEFDQTEINDLVDQLDLITKTYPIVGDEFAIKNE
jgi:hypothetical protein